MRPSVTAEKLSASERRRRLATAKLHLPTLATMTAFAQPLTLRAHGVRLEPLSLAHEAGLAAAAADGQLWRLRVTSVPEPQETPAYIEQALAPPPLPWATRPPGGCSAARAPTTPCPP